MNTESPHTRCHSAPTRTLRHPGGGVVPARSPPARAGPVRAPGDEPPGPPAGQSGLRAAAREAHARLEGAYREEPPDPPTPDTPPRRAGTTIPNRTRRVPWRHLPGSGPAPGRSRRATPAATPRRSA